MKHEASSLFVAQNTRFSSLWLGTPKSDETENAVKTQQLRHLRHLRHFFGGELGFGIN